VADATDSDLVATINKGPVMDNTTAVAEQLDNIYEIINDYMNPFIHRTIRTGKDCWACQFVMGLWLIWYRTDIDHLRVQPREIHQKSNLNPMFTDELLDCWQTDRPKVTSLSIGPQAISKVLTRAHCPMWSSPAKVPAHLQVRYLLDIFTSPASCSDGISGDLVLLCGGGLSD
jgi:hypothetical protein